MVTGPFPMGLLPVLNDPVCVALVAMVSNVIVISADGLLLCATVSRYAVFNATDMVAGSLVVFAQLQWIRLLLETQIPHPRVFISLFISPTIARHVPAPPVTVKLISICQSVSDAISGNSYVLSVGTGTVAPWAVVLEYTIFVVAAPFTFTDAVLPALDASNAYENVPKLLELGSMNENDASDNEYVPFFGPSVIAEIRGRKFRVDNTQLLAGDAKLMSVPCARFTVMSDAVVYDPHPVPYP